MCTNPVFFYIKKNRISNFEILWISSIPNLPDGFLDISGDMRTFPNIQECSEHIQSDSTFEKRWFSTQNQRVSPVGPQNWSGTHSMMKSMNLDGHREPAGNRCSSSSENVQKLHFWACKSSTGHPGMSRSQNNIIAIFLKCNVTHPLQVL